MRRFLLSAAQAVRCPLASRRVGRRLVSLCILIFSGTALWAQQIVSGVVKSGDSALANASVVVQGSRTGVMTNNAGEFSLTAPTGATLILSRVGYVIKKIVVPAGGRVEVQLEFSNDNLGEVVVVGYSTQKKATLTGSISVVKGADLVKSPQPDISNSLAGRFSGLIATNRSGEPGYDGSNIYIRGQATLNNNDVLVVVDGIPGQIGGLSRLNPNDIESLSILKDASASVYGSRAANGVILVTTKRGRTGKPVIDYSFNQGFSSPTRLPKMADAFTYATIQNEIAYYGNMAGGMNQTYSATELQKYKDGSDPLNNPNTDWPSLVLKKTALQHQHNLSVSGGGENVKYYLSAGLLNQDGIYKHGITNYKQYSFRSNIDANISNRLKVSLGLNGREEDRLYPMTGAGDIFRAIYRAYPTVAAQYPNGLYSTGIEGYNAAVQVTGTPGTNSNPALIFNGILKGSYSIPGVDGLAAEGFFSVDKSNTFDKAFSRPYNLYDYNKSTGVYTQKIYGGVDGQATLYESQTNQSQTVSNIRLNYVHRFGKHDVNAFVAYEQNKYQKDFFSSYRKHFPTAQTPELSQGGTADADRASEGNSYNFTRKSYIGRVAYNYEEKYLLEAQARIDGSSTFAPGHQYGFFPSVSAGWRISKESFFAPVSFVNDLKLRGSYGLLGNDAVDLFQYFDNYGPNNQYVVGGVVVPGYDLKLLANPDITWEKAQKLDLGFNATLLNHFNVEFIWFQQHRRDILLSRNASVPQLSGINAGIIPKANIGKVDNTGIEATVGYDNTMKNGISYHISGNITYAKNKIVYKDEASGLPDYQRETGRPIGTYLLYNTIGMLRTSGDLTKYLHPSSTPKLGDLIYDDYSQDGKISALDQVRSKYGNIPQITYGVSLGAGYKNVDISLLFAGQAKVSQYVLPESGTVGNFYSSWADNRWTPTNINALYPRVDDRSSNSVNGGQFPNTFWLNNASFIRLKNVELGYTVSSRLLAAAKISSLRFYASAFNVFTITKVKDYDPEGSSESGQFYPQQRIINLGLNLRF